VVTQGERARSTIRASATARIGVEGGIVGYVASTNLNLVRSLYTAWERGDWGSADWAHPEIEFVSADGPSRQSVSGMAALAEAWREFLETWRVEAEDFRELDDERVLVLIRIRGRGKASGLEVDQISAQGANLFHIRDGKVTRLALYWNRERAIADAGLSPEDGSATA
jgi:ketosteroid isomerase-like protein